MNYLNMRCELSLDGLLLGPSPKIPAPILHCQGPICYNPAFCKPIPPMFPLIKYPEDYFKIPHSTMLIRLNITSLKMIQMISAPRCHSFKPKFTVSPAARLRYATTASGFDRNRL